VVLLILQAQSSETKLSFLKNNQYEYCYMKKRLLHKLFGLILNLNVLFFISFSASAGELMIGSAAVKITPPIGIPMAGQYFERNALSIHDDLFAKTIVIEKNGVKVAIVTCDLVDISNQLVSDARMLAEKSTGIPAEHIMISATHTHTGPVIPSPGNINVPQGKIPEILSIYISKLAGLIAESIKKANDDLQPANISFGLGHEESISFNRRFYMTDGTVGWNPGKLNPMIIKPAGPIDPDVSVLYAESSEGTPISTYVNFALHLDIAGGLGISADMPYTLSKILNEVKSPEMTILFAQGCSGNINHVNVNSKEPQSGYAEAERIGTVLAAEVIKTYTKLKPFGIEQISVKSETVQLPLAEISKNDLAWAIEIASKFGKAGAAPFLDMVKAFKIIEVDERNGKPIDSEIQVFALGDTCAIVSLSGEIFTELGMYIKSRSPYPYTIIVELANKSGDYIPDMKAYIEGNYEPVSSRCKPGSGELLVKRTIEMLNELKMKNR
jgi:neutral ceramidase